MYCPICGEEVNLSQSQCPSCGTNLDWSDYQTENSQDESINSGNNVQTEADNHSYYKDINKDDPFAPNAGFSGVEFDVPSNATEQDFAANSEHAGFDSPEAANYQSDDLHYDYYDSEDEAEQRKRFIWLLLGAGLVILLLVLVFVLINRRNSGREVGPNSSSPIPKFSTSNSTSKEGTTATTRDSKKTRQSLIPSSNKNDIVYVTPTPKPTPTPAPTPKPTTTAAPSTKAPTTTTTESSKETGAETTTSTKKSDKTTTSSSDSSINNSSKETNSKQTTVNNNKDEPTASSTFASDHDTYLKLNSGNLPVEPKRFASPDKPGNTNPGGEVLPNNNSESKKLSNFINEALQNINAPVYNGAQVQDKTVQLPNFSNVKQVPSEIWVQTYLNQFLKTVKGSTNPFDTKEFKLSEIETFLQKQVNPEITLDPSAAYDVTPYVYQKGSDNGIFSIPETAIEPNEKIAENSESKTTFVPIETVKLKNGNYEVRMVELNYDLRSHGGLNYREITDMRHQKVVGLAIDSTKSVAKTPEDITNDGDSVFFMSLEEMKANLGYVKYTLKPDSNGNLTLISKISYAANASDSNVINRITEIEKGIYANLGSSSVRTAETDIPLMNNPKLADNENNASQIGTIRKDSQYLVFNIGSDSQYIALATAGDGDLIGYVNLSEE